MHSKNEIHDAFYLNVSFLSQYTHGAVHQHFTINLLFKVILLLTNKEMLEILKFTDVFFLNVTE